VSELKYQPVRHDHAAFVAKARQRKGFGEAYDALALEYQIARQMLAARSRAGLTQDAVAEKMGTTKSAISRLESAGKHAPSLTTLKRYASAVGCNLEVRLVPQKASVRSAGRSRGNAIKRSSKSQ
jgi:DNA-binding XRE family transcriptional regulator